MVAVRSNGYHVCILEHNRNACGWAGHVDKEGEIDQAHVLLCHCLSQQIGSIVRIHTCLRHDVQTSCLARNSSTVVAEVRHAQLNSSCGLRQCSSALNRLRDRIRAQVGKLRYNGGESASIASLRVVPGKVVGEAGQ